MVITISKVDTVKKNCKPTSLNLVAAYVLFNLVCMSLMVYGVTSNSVIEHSILFLNVSLTVTDLIFRFGLAFFSIFWCVFLVNRSSNEVDRINLIKPIIAGGSVFFVFFFILYAIKVFVYLYGFFCSGCNIAGGDSRIEIVSIASTAHAIFIFVFVWSVCIHLFRSK